MLEVSNIETFYGKIQALWGVSLKIEEAEIVALVGGNGAGKTTLLNTISGLLRPASGSVAFRGKRIDGLKPHAIVELGMSIYPREEGFFRTCRCVRTWRWVLIQNGCGKISKEPLIRSMNFSRY